MRNRCIRINWSRRKRMSGNNDKKKRGNEKAN
jgi:hypothetical protein